MIEVFRCPVCKASLEGWPPSRCASCGYAIETDEGVLILTDDSGLNLDGPGNKYIGFDTIAFQYDQTRHRPKQVTARVGKAIAEIVGPGKILLNVGAGTGAFDVEIAKAGCKVIAGDISLNMLKVLVSKLDRLPKHSILPCRLNAYSLPLLPGSVDAAMATALFHLVENPALIVKEIQRVLKPSQVFITIFIEHEGPEDDINAKITAYYHELLKARGVELVMQPGWPFRRTESELRNLFSECQIVESEDLTFRFTETPKRELAKTGNRAYSNQITLDAQVHNEIMEEIHKRLVSEYGQHFEDIEQEHCLKFRLGVFSD